ncbi:MAG TPA: DUF3806 domain-containing protein [Rhizomicrobium sp.]|jgi:hypothetical protein
MEQKAEARELNAEENSAFESGMGLVRRTAAELGTPLSLRGEEGDLSVLQHLLDTHVQWPRDDELAIGIGLAFGVVLENTIGLEWIRVTDEYGSETSLRVPGTTLWVHPISMITKRLNKGDEISLRHMLEFLLDRLPQLARKAGPSAD